MQSRRFGRIIAVLTSAIAEVPPKLAAYVAAKHALDRCRLAVELGPANITVNCVSPGMLVMNMPIAPVWRRARSSLARRRFAGSAIPRSRQGRGVSCQRRCVVCAARIFRSQGSSEIVARSPRTARAHVHGGRSRRMAAPTAGVRRGGPRARCRPAGVLPWPEVRSPCSPASPPRLAPFVATAPSRACSCGPTSPAATSGNRKCSIHRAICVSSRPTCSSSRCSSRISRRHWCTSTSDSTAPASTVDCRDRRSRRQPPRTSAAGAREDPSALVPASHRPGLGVLDDVHERADAGDRSCGSGRARASRRAARRVCRRPGAAHRRIGYDAWHDARMWTLARIPWTRPHRRREGRIPLRGRSPGAPKVPVLDLDNTLWEASSARTASTAFSASAIRAAPTSSCSAWLAS